MEQHAYYSLIQFLPDISRFEAVNIGIALLHTSGRAEAKLLQSNTRVRQVFGNQDWIHLAFVKSSLEKRLQRESFVSVEAFGQFAARRANLLQMTEPQSVATDDRDRLLDRLFDELVTTQSSFRRKRIDVTLGERLSVAGVRGLVEASARVRFPYFDQPFRAPYAYQNGRYNLLTAVQFNVDLKEMISKVAEKALEGRVLYENPDPDRGGLSLNVIGQFADDVSPSSRAFIERTLSENHVKLYDFENLDPLLSDIRQAAIDHEN